MPVWLVLIAVFATHIPTSALAQDYSVVFEGRPLKKVESSFERTTTQSLSADESFEYSVRIVERQGKYYWVSSGEEKSATSNISSPSLGRSLTMATVSRHHEGLWCLVPHFAHAQRSIAASH